jgi:hypothetical protein
METRSMISFDWALKRLLRSKSNFEVLEGFLSELLRRKIIIRHIGESEGNREDETDKSNRKPSSTSKLDLLRSRRFNAQSNEIMLRVSIKNLSGFYQMQRYNAFSKQ